MPQQQRRSVAATQVKAAPQCWRSACYNSAIATWVVAALPRRVLQQRRNNVANCNAPGHRCSIARSCSVASLLAIAAAAVELYTSDFCRTSIGFSSDVRPTFLRPTFVQRPACIIINVIVLRPACITVDGIALRPCWRHHPTSYLRHYWRHRPTSCWRHPPTVLRPVVLPTWHPAPTSCCLDVLCDTVLQSCVLHIVVVHLVVLCLVAYLVAFCRTTVLQLGRFKPYIVLEFCNWGIILVQNFGAWDNTMSSDDESSITHPEPRYQLRNNTQPFEPISLSSRSSR